MQVAITEADSHFPQIITPKFDFSQFSRQKWTPSQAEKENFPPVGVGGDEDPMCISSAPPLLPQDLPLPGYVQNPSGMSENASLFPGSLVPHSGASIIGTTGDQVTPSALRTFSLQVPPLLTSNLGGGPGWSTTCILFYAQFLCLHPIAGGGLKTPRFGLFLITCERVRGSGLAVT